MRLSRLLVIFYQTREKPRNERSKICTVSSIAHTATSIVHSKLNVYTSYSMKRRMTATAQYELFMERALFDASPGSTELLDVLVLESVG